MNTQYRESLGINIPSGTSAIQNTEMNPETTRRKRKKSTAGTTSPKDHAAHLDVNDFKGKQDFVLCFQKICCLNRINLFISTLHSSTRLVKCAIISSKPRLSLPIFALKLPIVRIMFRLGWAFMMDMSLW